MKQFNEKIEENTFHENIETIYLHENYKLEINYLPKNTKELCGVNSNITCLKQLLNLKYINFSLDFKGNINFDELPDNLEILAPSFNSKIINNNSRKLKYIIAYSFNLENLFAENLYIDYYFIKNLCEFYRNFDNIYIYANDKNTLVDINTKDFEKEEIIESENLIIGNNVIYYSDNFKYYIMKINSSEKIKIKNEIENLKNQIVELEIKLKN